MTSLVFRVDAGPGTGLGHLHRCLALASSPLFRDWRVEFVLDGEPKAADQVRQHGFKATRLPTAASVDQDVERTCTAFGPGGPNWVVVDSRRVGEGYLRQLRQRGALVAAVDDLGDRQLAADVIVNTNPFARGMTYSGGDATTLLLGAEYMLLRQEFWDVPQPVVRPTVSRVLVMLGAADRRNLMPALADAVLQTAAEATVEVVAGPFFADPRVLEARTASSGGRLVVTSAPTSLVGSMRAADLAISAGGQTLYELIRVGCPTIALEVSTDQTEQIVWLARRGVVLTAGAPDDGQVERAARMAAGLIGNPAARFEMSRAGRALLDGHGVHRVASAILRLTDRARRPVPDPNRNTTESPS